MPTNNKTNKNVEEIKKYIDEQLNQLHKELINEIFDIINNATNMRF